MVADQHPDAEWRKRRDSLNLNQPIAVSVFDPPTPNGQAGWYWPSKPARKLTTWLGLKSALERWRFSDSKESVGLWCPATFMAGTTRAACNVDLVTCLVWDYDDGTDAEDAVQPWFDWPWVLHTSYSHTIEHQKFRLIIPFHWPVPVGAWAVVWKHLRRLCIGNPDPACKDPSRIYFMPSSPSSDRHRWYWDNPDHDGAFLDVDWVKLQQSEAVKHRPRTPNHVRKLTGAERLLAETDETTRIAIAKALGCDIVGNRAVHGTCPRCKRNSLWMFIQPESPSQQWIRCNHQGESCGWWSHAGDI